MPEIHHFLHLPLGIYLFVQVDPVAGSTDPVAGSVIQLGGIKLISVAGSADPVGGYN
jgi:hypothetical protein